MPIGRRRARPCKAKSTCRWAKTRPRLRPVAGHWCGWPLWRAAIPAPEDAWLLPLKAQQNGFFSASFTTAAQSAAAADQLALHYQQAADPKAVAKQFGRLVKHKLRK